jgi:hypothetical protein
LCDHRRDGILSIMRSKTLVLAILCVLTPAVLDGEPGPPTSAGDRGPRQPLGLRLLGWNFALVGVEEPGPPTSAGFAGVGTGDVLDSAANGFSIKIGINIHASAAQIYDGLVHHIGDWWSSDHTVSNDSHNLSIDDKPMGCFCEKLPNNGGVRHADVIMVMPDKMLVMSGALGPLQRAGAIGTLSFVIQPIHTVTRLEVTYNVGGYMSGGLNTWADTVNKVLTEQVTRLKNYVETGSPTPAAGTKKSQ